MCLLCLGYTGSLVKMILDDYRASSTWSAPNNFEGWGSDYRFRRRGKDGTVIL